MAQCWSPSYFFRIATAFCRRDSVIYAFLMNQNGCQKHGQPIDAVEDLLTSSCRDEKGLYCCNTEARVFSSWLALQNDIQVDQAKTTHLGE